MGEIQPSYVDIGATHNLGRLRRLRMAGILGSLTAFGPLSIDMYLPSLPTIATDLHASPSLAQLTLTFSLLGLALGQLIAGPISDAKGRRKPLVIGLITYTATSLLLAFTQSVGLFIILRLLQGLAGSTGIVIANAVVRDYYSGSEVTKFYALLMLVNGAAPILAPLIGGQILRLATWQSVFIVLAFIGATMTLAVIFGLPESLPYHSRSSGGLRRTFLTFCGLLKHRNFMGYTFARGFVTAAMFAYIAGSPFVLQKIYGVSPQIFSIIFAVNGLGIILGSQLTPRFSVRYGEAKVLLGGLLCASVGSIVLLVMLLMHMGLFAVLPPLFVVVASVGVVGTSSTSLALQSQNRESAGSASALIGLAGMLAGGIVTPLVGLGGSHTAIPMGAVITLCDIVAVIGYLCLSRIHSA